MPRCCARAASTAASPSRRPTRTAAARSSRSTRARCRSATTSTSTASRPPRPAWSAPTWRTSPTRRRCSPPGAATRRSSRPTSRTRWRRSCSARRAGIVLCDEDQRRTAYHESGHALVGMLTPGADPVRKVSIIPRGDVARRDALGARRRALQLRRGALLARIRVALGGRVAEEVVYGSISAGRRVRHPAADDDRAPDGRPLGDEREIGPIAVLPREAQGPLLPGVSEVSESTQRLVDEEVRRIVDEAHAEVTQLLTEHRDQLDALTAGAAGAPRRSTRTTRTRRLAWSASTRPHRHKLSLSLC